MKYRLLVAFALVTAFSLTLSREKVSAAPYPTNFKIYSNPLTDGWASGAASSPLGLLRVGRDDFFDRGYMSFDASGLAGLSIARVTLWVYQANIIGDPYSVSPVAVDLVDYGTSLEAADYSCTVTGPDVGIISTEAGLGWKQLDVTLAIRYLLLTPSTTAQFRLRWWDEFLGMGSRAEFAPGEDPTFRPYLEVMLKSSTPGDMDGDARADITVWRTDIGMWYTLPSNSPNTVTFARWGVPTDIAVPGDYDNDGKTDIAVWRPETGTWYILPSGSPGTYRETPWGLATDKAVPGDYDGDGKTDLAFWRPGTGTWYVLPTGHPGTFMGAQWGMTGDTPVPADYDGDGSTDFAVYRPSNGTWYVMLSGTPGASRVTQWGTASDIPVPGDYDGDGKADIAVCRPGNWFWYVIPSTAPGSFIGTQWGISGDVPVPGDYDGDGKVDRAIFRPADGTWFVLRSGTPGTFTRTPWGLPTDRPISPLLLISGSTP